jgi:hypothetical protein
MEEVKLGLYKPDSITKNQVQYLHNSVVTVQSASEERAGEQDREVRYCIVLGSAIVGSLISMLNRNRLKVRYKRADDCSKYRPGYRIALGT